MSTRLNVNRLGGAGGGVSAFGSGVSPGGWDMIAFRRCTGAGGLLTFDIDHRLRRCGGSENDRLPAKTSIEARMLCSLSPTRRICERNIGSSYAEPELPLCPESRAMHAGTLRSKSKNLPFIAYISNTYVAGPFP